MVLINSKTWPSHRSWCLAAIAITIPFAAWWCYDAWQLRTWMTGSSRAGFTLGILGAALIAFEFMIWPRKRLRAQYWLGPGLWWMKAHVWLGIPTLVFSILHTGFYLGGPLSTTLLLLFLGVMASGVFGLYLQQHIPRRLMLEVPSETLYSQIDTVMADLRRDAQRIAATVCGAAAVMGTKRMENFAQPFGLPAGQHMPGHGSDSLNQTQSISPAASELMHFYTKYIDPYLYRRLARNPLSSGARSSSMFYDLRRRTEASAHPAIDALEAICEQRRQLSRQAQLHAMLHVWLQVHLPLSIALVILLAMHAWVAMMYW